MSNATDCIFCKIGAREIPCASVWESDDAIAFLDVNPLAEGHTLLIPKRHFADLRDIPPDLLGRMITMAPLLSRAIMSASNASGMNLLQNTGASAGQAVFHVHFHFIPRKADDGLGFRWNVGAYSEGRADEIRDAIRAQTA
jgi:histidine triad (HIT) family protein